MCAVNKANNVVGAYFIGVQVPELGDGTLIISTTKQFVQQFLFARYIALKEVVIAISIEAYSYNGRGIYTSFLWVGHDCLYYLESLV